jgi:hypothetical protein
VNAFLVRHVIPDLIRDPWSYWGQTPISLRCFAPHPQGEPKARRIGALTPKTEAVFASCAGDVPTSRGLPGGNSLFFCVAKRKVSQRKGDPMVWVPPLSLRATCGARRKRGLARTRLRLRQSLALIRFRLRSSAQPDGWGGRMRIRGDDVARLAATAADGPGLFARGRSTRGQMKSPSIAQRGEGGARGGSRELDLLPKAKHPRRSVMPTQANP